MNGALFCIQIKVSSKVLAFIFKHTVKKKKMMSMLAEHELA